MSLFTKVKLAWIIAFSGFVLAILGGPLCWGLYYHFKARSWQPVPARVVAIKNYPKSAEMNYEFAFNGAEYSGNQFAFLTEGTIPDKLRINDAYQVGDTITIYVNPANPNQSVVERRSLLWRYTWKPLLGIVLTVCIAVLVTFSVCGKVQPLARPSVAGQQ